MTEPSPPPVAGAGFLLVATMLFGGAVGLGVGALAGARVPFALAGFFIGVGAGFGLVYRRFKGV